MEKSVKRMDMRLSDAVEHVMNKVTNKDGEPVGNVGVFIIDGKLITTNQRYAAYETHAKRFFDSMVGTYNHLADARQVRDDLALFA